MLPFHARSSLRIEDYRVNPSDRPGWLSGTDRTPRVGEEIFCASGLGVVAALGGKTGDGSRLIEIRLNGATRRSFFAAASNVLLPPVATMVPQGIEAAL
jgi:hypothetical protein